MDPLPETIPGQLTLLEGRSATLQPYLCRHIAALARKGSVRVLDCGNLFNAYGLTRVLRLQTMSLSQSLERVHLARAFTCYQAAALLSQTSLANIPTMVLDLPALFQDDSIALWERRRLFRAAIERLGVLQHACALLVTAGSHALRDPWLLQALEAAANSIRNFEAPAGMPEPLRLF